MLNKLTCILSIFFSMIFACDNADIPSHEKLKISFMVLEKNFCLDNRVPAMLTYRAKMINLADTAVNSVLKNYPDNLELIIKSIRTLYVQTNYYLRTEQFTLAYHKFSLARKLFLRLHPDLDSYSPERICQLLAQNDPKLPAMYSLTLYYAGMIPVRYKESPISIAMGEKYLLTALRIRQIIDSQANLYLNVPDNSSEIGDAILFERDLAHCYIHTDRFREAEQIYLRLLTFKDSFNEMICNRGLLIIYQLLGQQADNKKEQTKYYKKAMKAGERCLKLINKEVGHYTKVSGIYRAVGNLLGDDANPFQDLNESLRMLNLAKKYNPEVIQETESFLHEECARILKKLGDKEAKVAKEMHWQIVQKEHIKALEIIEDDEHHLINYLKLGDLFLEQKDFVSANAFYSNGLSLTEKCLSGKALQSPFYERMAKVENLFLESISAALTKRPALHTAESFEALLQGYQKSLTLLRSETEDSLTKNSVEKVYAAITEKYKSFLLMMIKDLIDVLGPPPTEDYAIVAFGSIARGFVTPYSDFEWAILMADENDHHWHYFNSLSQLLNLRIIAMGETPIALLKGKLLQGWLQDVGPSFRGLTFDIYIAPHSFIGEEKLPLITSPKRLATVFEPTRKLESQKKAIFYNFTHLYGKKLLTDEYERSMEKILSRNYTREKMVEDILWLDVITYFQHLEQSLKAELPPVLVFYLKLYFYRPLTALLDTIALQHGWHASSPWQLLDMLQTHQFITQEEKGKLYNILDEIGTARLKTFFYYDKTRATLYLKDVPQDVNLLKYYDDERLKKMLEGMLLLKSKAHANFKPRSR